MKKGGLLFVLSILALGGFLFSFHAEAQSSGLDKNGKVPPGFSQGEKTGWESEYPPGWKRKGVFLDSAVQGLFYTTPTLRETTGPDGDFCYNIGERVRFYVGNPDGIFLGEALGQSVVTPVDIVPGAVDVTDQAVINIARLLQTLDADGDNNNGIHITPAIHDVVVSEARDINFDQTAAAFGADPEVTALLADLNIAAVFTDGNPIPRSLQPADQAQDHLRASLSNRVTVETSYGTLRGYGPTDATWQWLGIPYAKPPVGELRWRPPQPLDPWVGVREATAWGNQAASPPSWVRYGKGRMSEDCLYLNVTAPRDAKNLPVMVWFHGGGFRVLTGNSKVYNNPDGLPRKGVVLVVVNHRLGPFGYLGHPLLTAESAHGGSGNYGQMDLVAALEWVQDNITNFGGNPNNVTIFGQSGGGGKVHFLVASPLASGLFHRAIAESSRYTCPTQQKTLADAEAIGAKLAGALGVGGSNDVLAAMRAKSWVQVEAASRTLPEYDDLLPNVDGWYLPDTLRNIFEAGLQNDVPLIDGVCKADNPHNLQVFPLALPWEADNFKSNVYAYVFDRIPDAKRAEGAVAAHSSELQYVFNSPSKEWTDLDWQIADEVMTVWTNFAKTGNPGIPGKIEWLPTTSRGEEYLAVDQDGTFETRKGLADALE